MNVSAVFSGKTKSMGNSTFRLKTVPDPIAQIAGVHEGVVNRSLLLASPYIIPTMPPGFDFDLKYVVTGFTFVTDYNGDIMEVKVAGNRLTQDIVKLVTTAKKNKRVWFEAISVRGPDGDRTIAGINLKVQ